MKGLGWIRTTIGITAALALVTINIAEPSVGSVVMAFFVGAGIRGSVVMAFFVGAGIRGFVGLLPPWGCRR